jgi:23S rRNA pseudouridine1911/1915/1917 synthase
MPEEEQNDQNEQQDLFEHFRLKVDQGQSMVRIDKFVTERIENASRTRVQYAATAGNIIVNNNPVKPSYKVKPGDLIQILLPTPPREIELIPEDIPLNIVYEDDDVIVVNKEAGMVVHPAYGNYTGTLVNALMYHFRDLPLFNTGDARPGLVHRIDKNTSGILVIAKNEYALNRLSKQFYDRTTDRKYLALVWGIPDPREGTITGNVGRSIRDRKVMQVFEDGSQGKIAITHYKVVEDLRYTSLIECKLETGRTHQIRIHFSHIRHPLFNDEEYGGNQILKGTTFNKYQQFVKNCFKLLPGQALHARSLAFDHPVTRKRLSFDSELPAGMQQLIEKWRSYTAGRIEE